MKKSILPLVALPLLLAGACVTQTLHAMPHADIVKAAKLFNIKKQPVKRVTKKTQKPRSKRSKKATKTLTVTASAYTSHVAQTDSTPNIAAWGDKLRPGMKVIAVSRDLLKKYGLKHRSKVKIKGLKGHYLVLDKMNKRWKKRIDIYMGKNIKKARRWGKKSVKISW